jgi:hypothetical protein
VFYNFDKKTRKHNVATKFSTNVCGLLAVAIRSISTCHYFKKNICHFIKKKNKTMAED